MEKNSKTLPGLEKRRWKRKSDLWWDPLADFETTVLPNGLTVHSAYWPGRPWEAVGFINYTGARLDPEGLEGLAHFVEHMVSENASLPKKEIHAFLDNCGGIANLGATGYADVNYSFFVPLEKRILSRTLDIFGHMLLLAEMRNHFKREKQIIIGEINRDYPVKLQFELDMRERLALYPGLWLARSTRPFGTLESVEKITERDLQAHYDRYYTPANLGIVGVGGLETSEFLNYLSESPFMAKKEGARTPILPPIEDFPPPTETRYVFEVSKHVKIETPFEVGGFRSVGRIPGTVSEQAVWFLNHMLTEVLGDEVRERRGWTYYIKSSIKNFRQFQEISIDSDGLALKSLDKIEEVVEDCVASLHKKKDLFEQVKRRALAMNRMIDLTGKGLRDSALADLAIYQRVLPLAEERKKIEKVNMRDIIEALEWLKKEMRWTLIVRP